MEAVIDFGSIGEDCKFEFPDSIDLRFRDEKKKYVNLENLNLYIEKLIIARKDGNELYEQLCLSRLSSLGLKIEGEDK